MERSHAGGRHVQNLQSLQEWTSVQDLGRHQILIVRHTQTGVLRRSVHPQIDIKQERQPRPANLCSICRPGESLQHYQLRYTPQGTGEIWIPSKILLSNMQDRQGPNRSIEAGQEHQGDHLISWSPTMWQHGTSAICLSNVCICWVSRIDMGREWRKIHQIEGNEW